MRTARRHPDSHQGASRIAESPASVRALRRFGGRASCPRCNDTGWVWMVCPDAGAVRLPCECGRGASRSHHVDLVDVGLATAFAACCGAAYFLF